MNISQKNWYERNKETLRKKRRDKYAEKKVSFDMGRYEEIYQKGFMDGQKKAMEDMRRRRV